MVDMPLQHRAYLQIEYKLIMIRAIFSGPLDKIMKLDNKIVILALYHFVSLDDLDSLREHFLDLMNTTFLLYQHLLLACF